MDRRCVIVGDIMMDVTALIETDIVYASDTPAQVSLQPGGAAANTAAWLATTGHGATLVGCVGDDAFGDHLGRGLAGLGVDLRLQPAPGHTTGTCVIVVDRRRERTMFPDPGANSALTEAAFRDDVITAGCHVHLSGYTLINEQSRPAGLAALAGAERAGASVSLDPASAGPLLQCLDVVTPLLPRLDVLIANEAEASVLTGVADPLAALALLAGIVPTVVVKLGANGVAASSGGMVVQRPAHATDVIDTTGAGDAFTAGFLPVWMRGGSLVDALGAGQVMAARAVSRVGASPLVH